MRVWIGIDPGKSGAIAFIPSDGEPWTVRNDCGPHDLAEELGGCEEHECFAHLEKVHSSPQMGVKSAFTFGQSFGELRGILAALRVPFEEVSPAKWQGDMKCRTKGDKNVTKRKAQELFPSLKITHANADALLIAEYCRRQKS